jgi:hypothetical protein
LTLSVPDENYSMTIIAETRRTHKLAIYIFYQKKFIFFTSTKSEHNTHLYVSYKGVGLINLQIGGDILLTI